MFQTATSLINLILLLGLDQAYVREYSVVENKSQLWYTALFLPVVLSIGAAAIGIIFAQPIGHLLFGSTAFLPVIGTALAIPLLILYRFLLLSVRMAEAGKLYSAMQIVSKAVIAITTIGFVVLFGSGLSQILFPVLIGHTVVILFSIPTRHVPTIDSLHVSSSQLKSMLHFGMPLVAASAFMWILNSLDKVALRTWSTFSELGIYAAAFRLSAMLLIIHQAFTTFWAPTVYRWYENGVSEKRFQRVANTITYGLTIIYALLMALRWIIIWLLGPEYREAVHIVPLAAIYPIMITMSETTVMGIRFSRKTYWETIVTAVAALVNIAGNWILVPKYGAFGAALATAISFCVFFWMRTIVSNRLWHGLLLNRIAIGFSTMVLTGFIAIWFADWRVDAIVSTLVIIPFAIALFRQNRDLLSKSSTN
jgi:O-antigen/teichoic acid export membrane protein